VRRRILTVLVAAHLAAGYARADDTRLDDPALWRLCSGSEAIPAFPYRMEKPADLADDEVAIEADSIDVQVRERTIFEGDVELRRLDQWVGTPLLEYDHALESWHAERGLRYQDSSIRFTAARGEGQPPQEQHRLEDAEYQLIGLRGNGHAGVARIDHGLGWLHNATFTTCDPEGPHWQIEAKRIRINSEEGFGTAWGAKVRVGNVPVFYLPYIIFPIDDTRRSGFLYPSLGLSGRSGFELEVPYYLNLAPNYDATLTPHLMTDRGVKMNVEARYLFPNHRGLLEGGYLPDDNEANRDRGDLHFEHFSRLSRNWQTTANVNLVSDDRFFEDFGESVNRAATRLLASNLVVRGRGQGWRTEFAVEDWDLVDPLVSNSAEPFKHLPRVNFQWEQPVFSALRAGLQSELIAFDHDSLPAGDRIDLRPYLAAPMQGLSWFVRPQIAYRYTAYEVDSELAVDGDRSLSRELPIYSLDSGLFFERQTKLFNRNWLQTLEPRFYYLRAPFRDQTDLPNFDARELTFSFAQLFRDNTFSGADRQINANQATMAVTTRFLDPDSGREYFSVGVGQARFFDSPRVGLPNTTVIERDESPLVGELDVRLDDRWSLGTTQHWDTARGRTDLSVARTQYRFKGNGVANLSYRFRRDELEQTDVSFVYPLTPVWRLVGRWNYSIRDDSTVEALGGVEWDSCCLGIRMMVRNFVTSREGDKSNQIYLEFELKGLTSAGRDTRTVLESAILGYER
jgi:LPS-assembly protein